MGKFIGAKIHITGIVQGVGFRPFVYNEAIQLDLTGWVRNTSAGVDILVDGDTENVQSFIQNLQTKTPALAKIDHFATETCPPNGFQKFEIIPSEEVADAFQPISPDVATCPDCLRELFNPADRRFLYPFINCTNCGPRFTIIQDIPYDRPKTTMSGFSMCPDCESEYLDPLNRRFHAQPIACPVCGPKIWLEIKHKSGEWKSFSEKDALFFTQKMLREGKIIAIKGLGGFHLACDATNPEAVSKLRSRKLRVDKPFAIMVADLDLIKLQCIVTDSEEFLLQSIARPIVILKRRQDSVVAREIAPGQDNIGVMLPYTPLHYLLFHSLPDPDQPGSQTIPAPQYLVMTSGNLSEEPIVTDNDDARHRLDNLADALLLHDRPIYVRCDDSVMRFFSPAAKLAPVRRSRGYSPYPVKLAWKSEPILATGAELKNTFCLANQQYAFVSHHIGDLENYETLQSFEQGIDHFERLFRVKPVLLAYDMHPNYLSSRYAIERLERENLTGVAVQHHHAHIASGMAEHGLPVNEEVIGVSFDGTGYGVDGAIWGGEFLLARYDHFIRYAHFDYFSLPGGDMATRKPARIGLALLAYAGLEWDPSLPNVSALCPEERMSVRAQLIKKINLPDTSSMGRLFDGVASLAGLRQEVNYEAQAAIEFEAVLDPAETSAYPYELISDSLAPLDHGTKTKIGIKPLIQSVVEDVYRQTPISKISARFHNSIVTIVIDVCQLLRAETGHQKVVLSGGVWQNMILLSRVYQQLSRLGFQVIIHSKVPANDGGISLGQAAIGSVLLNR